MQSQEVEVKNETGIHARPAVIIVETASKFACEVSFIKDDVKANAKSIMSLLLLAAEPGAKILIQTEGSDEEAAMQAMTDLFQSKFQADDG